VKKFIPLFVALAVFITVTSAFAQGPLPVPAPFVVPPVFIAFVAGFFAFLGTQGVKAILALTGIDLSGGLAVIVAAVVNVVVDYLGKLIGTQTTDQQALIAQALVLVVSLLAMYGVHYAYRGLKGASPFSLNAKATFKK